MRLLKKKKNLTLEGRRTRFEKHFLLLKGKSVGPQSKKQATDKRGGRMLILIAMFTKKLG